jgi:hypothetical protein
MARVKWCRKVTGRSKPTAALGYTVKEMLGGFEYWAREGWAVETGIGAITRRSVDPLTAPASGISCAC